MDRARRATGFEPLGALRPADLGLPRRETRRLTLADAWRRVAGDAVGRRLSAVQVTRGTVEIEAGDPRWADDLRDMLPLLVSRLSRCAPDLGIRRFRLRIRGRETDRAERSIAVERRPDGAPER
jgi:hypothetical protein